MGCFDSGGFSDAFDLNNSAMPFNPPLWTLDDLRTICAAIATGTLEVRYADRTIVYRSMGDLLKAKVVIEQYLNPPQIRQYRFHPKDGF